MSERYLRELVAGSRGCLSSIAPTDARVLELRTGIGAQRSYSAGEVARILGVAITREHEIERRAAAALRLAASDRSCGVAAPPRSVETPASSGAATAQQLPAAAPTPAASAPSHTVHRRHSRRRVSRPRRAVKAASARLSVPLPGTSPTSSSPATLPLVLIAGVIVLLVLAVRRAMPLPSFTAPVRAGSIRDGMVPFRPTDVAGVSTTLGAVEQPRERPEGRAEEAAAYDRLYQFEDPGGASDMGVLLAERGDVAGALAALRRADEAGDAAGASNLGVLLERQGDLPGALEAYRRADQRGDAEGAFNLGGLLAEMGDLGGASDAYRRARARGDQELSRAADAALGQLMGRD